MKRRHDSSNVISFDEARMRKQLRALGLIIASDPLVAARTFPDWRLNDPRMLIKLRDLPG